MVKKALTANVETYCQTWDWNLTPLCLQNTTGTLANNYIILNPSSSTSGLGYTINRGSGSAQMIGDKIRTKRLMLKYVLSTNQTYNATTNPFPGRPIYVRFYLYKWKKQPLNDPQVTNICGFGANANFFEQGTSDIGFEGDLSDLNKDVNSNQYTFLKQYTFKLGSSIPYQGTLNIGSPAYNYANNDFKYSYFGKLNLTKYIDKNLSRDDNGDWMNTYLILLCSFWYADGALASNVTAPFTFRPEVDLFYTDA